MKNGNVKQVAAFGKLVGICSDIGARYNPNKASLKPTALTTLFEQAQQSAEAVMDAHANYVLAVKTRVAMYESLPPFVSRVVVAARATDGSAELLNDLKALRRAYGNYKKRSLASAPDTKESGTEIKTHTSSRLDYDNQVNTFAKLVKLVQRIAQYNPNEADLSLEGLNTKLSELKNANSSVVAALNALNAARQQRDKVFYGKNGLYETASGAKDYIRSIDGIRSPKAHELSQVKMKNRKK